MALEISVRHYYPSDPIPIWAVKLQRSVDRIEGKLDTIMATQADIKAKLDALTANVADLPTIEGSLETLLTNLQVIIAALKAQIANTDVPQALIDQVDALSAAVSTHKQKIIDDVTANTPAA